MILSGTQLARDIRAGVGSEVTKLEKTPKLVIVLTGKNPASEVYVSNKQKACEKVGIECEILRFETVTSEVLSAKIKELNEDSDVTGILLQSPLCEDLDLIQHANLIDPFKDVDGLGERNSGRLYQGRGFGMVPATPRGIIELLTHYKKSVSGKNVTVIGRSPIVGKPLGMMLLQGGATVTWCHSKTPDISVYTKESDIIISAVGQPKLITASMVKPGVTIIDVGINRNGEEGLCGDTDFENLKDICDITPVPGGVGPMTIACLLENILVAHSLQEKRNAK